MKKQIISFSILLMAVMTANAKFILVNNNAGAIEKFQTAQTAYDSCEIGDTIYLAPSPTNYGNITIKKRITLLGAGLKDKSGKVLTIFSKLYGFIVDTSGNSVKTSGTIISGLRIESYGHGSGRNNIQNVKNIYVFNNYFNEGLTISDGNSFVFDNIINGTYNIYLGNNVTFHNNVITCRIFNGTNCNISNNIFLGASPISGFNGSAFTNNIFYSSSGAETSLVNSYANNVQGTADLPTGNLSNQDMTTIFAESAVGTITDANLISLSYALKAGSPALTYGVDGTEVGVYGNVNPWPKGVVYTRSPGALPVVTSIRVQNQTVAPGATLKFNLKAKSLK